MWFQCTFFFSSIVAVIGFLIVAAVILVFIWTCYFILRNEIEVTLLPALERRRMERAPQVGDVTTELATAPGEAPSYQ